MQRQDRAGSAIVHREDKQDLRPWHVEALVKYCCDEVPLILTDFQRDGPEIYLVKQKVVAMICKPSFRRIWHNFFHDIEKDVQRSTWDKYHSCFERVRTSDIHARSAEDHISPNGKEDSFANGDSGSGDILEMHPPYLLMNRPEVR